LGIALAAAATLSPPVAFAQVGPNELERAVEETGRRDSDLRGFYAGRGYRPLWIEDDRLGPAAEALVELVSTARYDGLSRKALQADRLADAVRRARRGRSDDLVRAEVALSRTFAAYVQGTRMPREAGMSYQSNLLEPVVPSVGSALAAAAGAPSLSDYVTQMRWMHPLYSQLRAALAERGRGIDPADASLIQLNLERARAIPANPASRYVLIDAAGAKLTMYENGRPVDSMRVVVGKPSQPTPMIAGLINAAILNPYWNVPPDLVRDRTAYNVNTKGIGYLKTGGYQVLSDFTDKAKLLNPAKIDWKGVAAGTKTVRVRQLPGKANFMGKVKYTFPNDLGIYLHDTPDKDLMLEDTRQASSGCVRLEDAPRLGRWLFGKMPVAKPKAVEQTVPLDQPVPVYITYLTAAPEDGQIVFREDTYQRDAKQLAVLNRATRGAR
jgi:murein L,D-transpeptidase YcbB/YkuD